MNFSQSSLDFLRDLGHNNNRDWFQANKKRYEKDLKQPFEHLVGQLISSFRQVVPGLDLPAKEAIFRLHRDTRFSQDKTPYKTNVSAVISPAGRKDKVYPGFYLSIGYGVLSMGGGAYFMEKEHLYHLRQHIVRHPAAFRELLSAPDFVAHYGGLQGERNKILPADFKAAATAEPLLYNKQFYYMSDLDPALAIGEGFVDLATAHFRAAQPLNTFLAAGMGL